MVILNERDFLTSSRSRLLWDLITVIKSLNFADNNMPFLRESKSEILLLVMKRSCMDLQLDKPGGCLRFWLHVIVLMQLCKLLRLINVFYYNQWNPALCCFKQKTIRGKLFGGQGWRSGETHSPPTNMARVQIPAPTPHVGWVCCWFSPLLREVFLRVLRFSPLLKNQHFQIPIRSGTHGHI